MKTSNEIDIHTDLVYADIAGIPTKASHTWTLVGDPSQMSWHQQRNTLGNYFAEGCVDGAAVLLTAEQDQRLLEDIKPRLAAWMGDPQHEAALLTDNGNIAIARWGLSEGRSLWVIAECGGTYLYSGVCDALFQQQTVETFLGDHMELEYECLVVEQGQCHQVWKALLELIPSPQYAEADETSPSPCPAKRVSP